MNTIAQVVTSNEKVNAKMLVENEVLRFQVNKLICHIETLVDKIDKDSGATGMPLVRARDNAQTYIETIV